METLRRDLKAWNIRAEWATDRDDGKVFAIPANPHSESEKGESNKDNAVVHIM